MITFKHTGSFKNTEKFLSRVKNSNHLKQLERYAQEGVTALASATPVNTGKTAASWSYEIKYSNNTVTIFWTNSNVVNGVNIAIILQYGHGTRNGGYVQGRDYINPTIAPIFDKIAEKVWNEVKDG